MAKQQVSPISTQLRIIIDECGLTRYEIAQRTGIDQSALARFYSGERGLSMTALDALGMCLELTITLPKKRTLKDRNEWLVWQKTKRRAT